MTVTAFPVGRIRTKRCNDRALELLRAEVKSDLIASKNGESRALRALEVVVRLYIAACWAGTAVITAAIAIGLPSALLVGLYIVAKRLIQLIIG